MHHLEQLAKKWGCYKETLGCIMSAENICILARRMLITLFWFILLVCYLKIHTIPLYCFIWLNFVLWICYNFKGFAMQSRNIVTSQEVLRFTAMLWPHYMYIWIKIYYFIPPELDKLPVCIEYIQVLYQGWYFSSMIRVVLVCFVARKQRYGGSSNIIVRACVNHREKLSSPVGPC